MSVSPKFRLETSSDVSNSSRVSGLASTNAGSALNFAHNVQHVRFDDLGHFSELEDTERIFKLIETFAA